jgi:hypothetical protein
MSRTSHHKGQKHNKQGLDFCGKYKVNRLHGGGYGREPKDCAHKEMRNDAKVACQVEEHLIEYWEERHWVEPLDDSPCPRCGRDDWCMCYYDDTVYVWEFKSTPYGESDYQTQVFLDGNYYDIFGEAPDDTCLDCGLNEFIGCECI